MSLRWFRSFAAVSLLVLAGLGMAGCGKESSAPPDRVPPNPSAPARYGPPTGVAAKEIPRALPPSRDTNWLTAPFWVLHSELSPGVLVHSSTRYLGLFADLVEADLGAPAHVAWSTKDGPRAFPAGETHDARGLEENWLLVWFAGAKGWTNWDSPWAVFLQRKPTWLRLDERGLHLEFPASAGDVVVMPLYGYFKLPPPGRDYLAEHGLKSRKLHSWTWEKALARDPLTRLRYWAGASREFPIYCEETFSVDRARDELAVRSRIQFHSIDDDWKTPHVKLAPVSPVLALAARDKDFPARFSKPFHDMEMPTPFGPYAGVQGVDSFDVTFPWLHYVNETEAFQPADTNAHPTVARALSALGEMFRTNANIGQAPAARYPDRAEKQMHILYGVEAYGKALPYLHPASQTVLAARLRQLLLDSGPPWHLLATSQQHGLGYGAFQALWAYGHFTGDWETVRTVWTRWRGAVRFSTGLAWAEFGRPWPSFAAPGAAECAALARVAYRMGDLNVYHYASFRSVQALTHAWTARRGGEYFRRQQPWDSMEWLAAERAETNATRLYPLSWRVARWRDADMARFHRDYFSAELRGELDWLGERWKSEPPPFTYEPFAPFLAAARSLFLNEGPAELARVAGPDQFTDVPHQFLAVLRAGRSPRYERLIPPGEASPFVTDGERDTRGASPSLMTWMDPAERGWPRPRWPAWSLSEVEKWQFGTIKPVRDGQPASVRRQALNWNTEVVTYGLP